jgi:hypothetical protein
MKNEFHPLDHFFAKKWMHYNPVERADTSLWLDALSLIRRTEKKRRRRVLIGRFSTAAAIVSVFTATCFYNTPADAPASSVTDSPLVPGMSENAKPPTIIVNSKQGHIKKVTLLVPSNAALHIARPSLSRTPSASGSATIADSILIIQPDPPSMMLPSKGLPPISRQVILDRVTTRSVKNSKQHKLAKLPSVGLVIGFSPNGNRLLAFNAQVDRKLGLGLYLGYGLQATLNQISRSSQQMDKNQVVTVTQDYNFGLDQTVEVESPTGQLILEMPLSLGWRFGSLSVRGGIIPGVILLQSARKEAETTINVANAVGAITKKADPKPFFVTSDAKPFGRMQWGSFAQIGWNFPRGICLNLTPPIRTTFTREGLPISWQFCGQIGISKSIVCR